MTFLKVSAITKTGNDDIILDSIAFTQRRLQKIAIAGETGSGKSTLLKIIAGLIPPDKGEVIFENQQIKDALDALVPGQPGICYLSQDFELPKFLRVGQVLQYANKESASDAALLYEVCEISHLLERKTDALSGGERQRIAIARLLTTMPKLLLLDEPFSNLDRVHKNVLKKVIRDIGERLRVSCILISHDPEDVLSWADTVLVLKDGRVVQKGDPEKIYREPVSEYVAGLFGRYTLLDRAVDPVPGLFPRRLTGKRWFARPEQFALASRGQGVPGKVTTSNFMGSHYELEIACFDRQIVVRHDRPVKEGKAVYVVPKSNNR